MQNTSSMLTWNSSSGSWSQVRCTCMFCQNMLKFWCIYFIVTILNVRNQQGMLMLMVYFAFHIWKSMNFFPFTWNIQNQTHLILQWGKKNPELFISVRVEQNCLTLPSEVSFHSFKTMAYGTPHDADQARLYSAGLQSHFLNIQFSFLNTNKSNWRGSSC